MERKIREDAGKHLARFSFVIFAGFPDIKADCRGTRQAVGGTGPPPMSPPSSMPDHHPKHFTCVERCWKWPPEQLFLSNAVAETWPFKNECDQTQFGYSHSRHWLIKLLLEPEDGRHGFLPGSLWPSPSTPTLEQKQCELWRMYLHPCAYLWLCAWSRGQEGRSHTREGRLSPPTSSFQVWALLYLEGN